MSEKLCPHCGKGNLVTMEKGKLIPFPFLLCPLCYYGERLCPECDQPMRFSSSGLSTPIEHGRAQWKYHFICMNFSCRNFNKQSLPVYVVK